MKSMLLVIICVTLAPLLHAQQFETMSLADIQKGLRSQEFTLGQLHAFYLQRIHQQDKDGLSINAIAQLSKDTDKHIRSIQNKLDNNLPLGPLFGAFILVKDNIDIKGQPNTAGSWLMREHYPKSDAQVIAKLRKMDAVILGKTNLSEWANFRSPLSSSGWSSMYGQTKNPHDTSRSPCGSSSGSGAAIAVNFATVAIGTETDGSIVCPAAVNGIVGFKPTLGVISRQGIIPIAHSQDTAGPMGRTVSDTYALFTSMLTYDDNDALSENFNTFPKTLSTSGLKGKRVGIVTDFMGYHPQLDAVFEQATRDLIAAGAVLIEDVKIATYGQWNEDEYLVLLSEFKAGLEQYLKSSDAPITSLQDLIAKNRQFKHTTMPIFGQEILLHSLKAPTINDVEYQQARQRSKRLAGAEGIDATLAKYTLDLLVAPTTGPAWKIDHVNGDHFSGSASSAAAVSGYPHITVPMGQVAGLPVGLSLIGAKREDVMVFEAALAYERQSHKLIRPKLIRSAPVE